jgi:hypothetical protein
VALPQEMAATWLASIRLRELGSLKRSGHVVQSPAFSERQVCSNLMKAENDAEAFLGMSWGCSDCYVRKVSFQWHSSQEAKRRRVRHNGHLGSSSPQQSDVQRRRCSGFSSSQEVSVARIRGVL